MKEVKRQSEIATFGAGCFWGVEESFAHLPGVVDTAVGYMGGTLKNPSYEDVCTSKTVYAEVVQVTFDPKTISYGDLLKHFFEAHDPTALNRQGPDVGTQYRSVIFFHSKEQEEEAEKSKAEWGKSGRYSGRIVTSIEPASTFWRAQEYHQRYLEKRGLATCQS